MSDSIDLALFQAAAESKAALAKVLAQSEFKEEINQSIKTGFDEALKSFRDRVKDEIDLATRTVRAETEGQTAKALQEVANSSVDKTLKIVGEMRFWLASIALTFLLATGLVGWQFYDKMMKLVEDKVNGWLAVDEGSPVHTRLEELRTRSLLDAYLIRAAKQVHGDRFNSSSMKLGAAEVLRLLLLMKDPRTSDTDFLDAAKVISMSRGPILGIYPDPQLAEVAKAVFETNGFSGNKLYGLLTAWGNEAVIWPYAEKILDENNDLPKAYKNAAFRIVSHQNGRKALEYAVRQLGQGNNEVNVEDRAAFIAEVDPMNDVLRQWIANPNNKKLQRYPLILAGVAESMCKSSEKARNSKEITNAAAIILNQAIEEGVSLDINALGNGYGDIYFRIEKTGDMQQVESLQTYLKANSVMSAVLQPHTASIRVFKKYVKALQIVKDGTRVAELSANVSNGGAFVLREGQRVSAQVTDEPVLIRISSDDDLTINWRSKNGIYASGVLDKVETGSVIGFSYSFDPEIIGKLETRRNDEYFLN